MKRILYLLFILSVSSCSLKKKTLLKALKSESSDLIQIKSMTTLIGQDTVEIKRFDKEQNLVFYKISSSYGIDQLLGWEYENDKLLSYTWSHSNVGFVESEYEYDSLNNSVDVYTYNLEDHSPPQNIKRFNSLNGLKNSKEYLTYYNNGIKILKSTKYYEDDLLIKELEYKSDTRIDTIYYTYNKNQLISKKHCYGHNSSFNELVYKYDELGNELSWMKIYNSKDTSVVYNKNYQEGLLIEVIGIEKGKIESFEKFNYTNQKLKSQIQSDSKGIEKIRTEYFYTIDGRIDYVDRINKYLGQTTRTYYSYY